MNSSELIALLLFSIPLASIIGIRNIPKHKVGYKLSIIGLTISCAFILFFVYVILTVPLVSSAR